MNQYDPTRGGAMQGLPPAGAGAGSGPAAPAPAPAPAPTAANIAIGGGGNGGGVSVDLNALFAAMQQSQSQPQPQVQVQMVAPPPHPHAQGPMHFHQGGPAQLGMGMGMGMGMGIGFGMGTGIGTVQVPLAMPIQGFPAGGGVPPQASSGVQWQGVQQGFWPPQQVQQVSPQQQQSSSWPAQGGQVLQTVPAPASVPTLQMLASAYQLWLQQQQQQQQQQHQQGQLQPQIQQQPQQYQQPQQLQQPPPEQRQQLQHKPQRQQRTRSSDKRPRTPPPPVGSRLDDESRLIDALKACKTGGITPREALEKLDGVNGHSASAWKDHFLDHLERLYVHLRSSPERNVSSSGLPSRSSASQRPRQPEMLRASAQQSPEKPRRWGQLAPPRMPRMPPPARPKSPNPIAGEEGVTSDARVSELAPISGTGRQRRGERIAQFHAMTLIPHTDGRTRPSPPPKEAAGRAGTFTEADCIFFIHYLRWRLARDAFIVKDELYKQLAEEIPSHSADAWKRHWDNHPELPDQILIEATQRAQLRGARSEQASSASNAPLGTDDDDGAGDNGDESDPSSSGANEAHNEDEDSAEERRAATFATRGTRVTREDLRAMARYIFEKAKANEWDMRTSATQRWSEFAQRPKNRARRSLMAWLSVHKAKASQIQAYLKEYQNAQKTRGKKTAKLTPPPPAAPAGAAPALPLLLPPPPAPPAKAPVIWTRGGSSASLSKSLPDARDRVKRLPSLTVDEKRVHVASGSSSRGGVKPDPDAERKRSADRLTGEDGVREPKRLRECAPPEVIELSD